MSNLGEELNDKDKFSSLYGGLKTMEVHTQFILSKVSSRELRGEKEFCSGKKYRTTRHPKEVNQASNPCTRHPSAQSRCPRLFRVPGLNFRHPVVHFGRPACWLMACCCLFCTKSLVVCSRVKSKLSFEKAKSSGRG